jgi:mannose-6-phosphate isomerase-like protein (cupin superfamily)
VYDIFCTYNKGIFIMQTQYKLLLKHYGVFLNHIPIEECSIDALLFRFKHFPYQSMDVFTSHCAISAMFHYHHATEVRVVIEGTGTYVFVVDDQLCVVDVGPGDCITIPKTIIHAFSSEDLVKFVRCFEDADYTSYVPSLIVSDPEH